MPQRGWTLVEVALVLALSAILGMMLVPSFARWADRLAVWSAANDVEAFYHAARLGAITQGGTVRLELTPDRLRAVLESEADSVLLAWPGPSERGVSLVTSRPLIRLSSNGLGLGAANTKWLLLRGTAGESLTVSRLGRLKR